jgi:hypothetical protein
LDRGALQDSDPSVSPDSPPSVRLEAYKLSLDVGPMVVDVIKDQNPARRLTTWTGGSPRRQRNSIDAWYE